MAYTKMTSKITVRLEDAIDYIENPKKTENLEYVYGGNCSPEFAAAQFDMIRRNADFTGKNLAYHFTQSFAPDETTPEQAYEIGKKLCERFLQGEYQFVLATHTDKDHIHNHIIINSVNRLTGQSFSRQHDRNDNPAWKTVIGYNKEALDKINAKALNSNMEFEVSGLEEKEILDVFKDVELVVAEVAIPSVSEVCVDAYVKYNGDNSKIGGQLDGIFSNSFKITDINGEQPSYYKEGDTVIVSIADSVIKNFETKKSLTKYKFLETSREYVLEINH